MKKRKIDYAKLSGTFEDRKAEIAKFNLMDDTFFSVVMEDNPRACEELLRILLDKPDLIVTSVRTQDSLRNLYGHSAVLDVMAEDSKGKHYIIEIQVRNEDNILKRIRIYQSVSDYKLSDKGSKYEDIPDLYVIFITEFDMFKKNQNCYHIKRVIEGYETDSDLAKQADNGVHEYFFSVKPDLNRDNTKLSQLLNYMADSALENNDFGALSESVRSNKIDEKGVGRMCELVKGCAEERYEEGKAEGKAEGIAEGKAESLKLLIESGMSESEAKKRLCLD